MQVLHIITIFTFVVISTASIHIPLVLTTWKFKAATQTAWDLLKYENHALNALVAGCKSCQDEQCDYTVGFGGSPDENGETTLDALIFDGSTMDMGAIGGLRRVKNVIQVARHVLENTDHSILVGDLATNFAKQFRLPEESLSTNYSVNMWKEWKSRNCQPNFWKNVEPDPKQNCGPYKPVNNMIATNKIPKFNSNNHDTIGMIVMDTKGNIVAGTSTNGANHKVAGRVGDSPIPGAGAYADNEVGAAAATGDGDIMMRFLPSFLAVEQMRNGASPAKAANTAIKRIAIKYPNFFGGIITVNKEGIIGAACNGMDKFPYTIANNKYDSTVTQFVVCSNVTRK